MATSAQAAQQLDQVIEALEASRVFVAGYDQARAAYELNEQLTYSALRTKIEQALKAGEQIRLYLVGSGLTGIEPCITPLARGDSGAP